MKLKQMLSVLLALVLALGTLTLPALAAETVDVESLYKNRDVDDSWSADKARTIDLNSVTGCSVSITAAGDYVLSGTMQGQVTVDAPEDAKVRLILNGVTITSAAGPAIYEKQADKLVITLAEGTENTLTDGTPVTDGDDTIAAALYAEDDLSINGRGSLTANGTQKHGIQSKADLIIAGGSLTVSAVKDGIRGRNSVLVLGGTMTVTAGGDGITTTRTDRDDKGWIVLAGGSAVIVTGGGAGTVKTSANSQGRGRMDDWNSASQTSDDGTSQKAVKAATDLTVLDGTWNLDCADDGLHAVNVTVLGGTFTISTGDDAMHADENLTVNGGTIDVVQSYEGLEGTSVTVNGGDIRIVASDDGLNAGGGSDGSGFGGWGRAWGGGGGEADDGSMLTVTGGTLAVTAGGDGLDSNGSIAVTGGVIGVWTASSGMEGPIDFNGTGTMTGGTLITASSGGGFGRGGAVGLSGLRSVTLSVSGQAGETLTLTDAQGTALASFTPANAFSTLTIASGALGDSGSFTLLGGSQTLYSGSMADAQDSNSWTGSGFGGPGFGGPGYGGPGYGHGGGRGR
ncbi:MAG: carbohydrate-binding domain-containing protein [Clostridia bacterium]|nr:carbohydrate-binding domain-containing protein [Clostridia bacterium]